MMIDKTLRKATAERHGPMVVIHMTGGCDCEWMNMYLDCEQGQMTCDSDIGFYSFHWGGGWDEEDFISFCIRWFSSEEWLLRKCVGELHIEKAFDREASIEALRRAFAEEHETDEDEEDSETFDLLCDFDRVLEIAGGYDDHARFATALCVAADERGVDLPDEWWSCLVEDYTPWQKRFAEICREVIVPELKRMMDDGQIAPSKPSVKEIKNALMEAKAICCGTVCMLCPLAVKGVCFATASSIEYHPHNISVIDGPAYPKKWTTEWDGGADDENA